MVMWILIGIAALVFLRTVVRIFTRASWSRCCVCNRETPNNLPACKYCRHVCGPDTCGARV